MSKELDIKICLWRGWTYKNRPTKCCQQAHWDMVDWPVFGPRGGGYHDHTPPKYSSNDGEAQKLMEELRANGYRFAMEATDSGWTVNVTCPDGKSFSGEGAKLAKAFTDSLLLAIDAGVESPDVISRRQRYQRPVVAEIG